MAFLSGIISSVIVSLLSGLGGWLLHYFQVKAKDAAEQKAAEGATQKVVDDDKAAVTPAERDDAAKNIAGNL